jgi:hypothetical protein
MLLTSIAAALSPGTRTRLNHARAICALNALIQIKTPSRHPTPKQGDTPERDPQKCKKHFLLQQIPGLQKKTELGTELE